MSQSAYARMERGESNAWASHLDAICRLFEIQPEELLRQEQVSISYNKGQSQNAYIFNSQLPGKIIAQLEKRIAYLEKEVKNLREQLERK